MIPYDDLVASLTSWRERQGLPVHSEDLFDVDASAGLGVADALATPLVLEPSHHAEQTGETHLAADDVVSADENLAGLSELGQEDAESTFIGDSPAWSDGDEAPLEAAAEGGPWETAIDDATGESPVAPPAPHDPDAEDFSLGAEIDAALAEGDPTPDVPPPNPADADADAADAEGTFVSDAPAAGEPMGYGDAPPFEAADPALDPDPAADTGETEAGDLASGPELVADDGAIVDEVEVPSPFQDAATAIRDPAAEDPGIFDQPGDPADAAFDVDVGDVLESEADPDAGDDPFRP